MENFKGQPWKELISINPEEEPLCCRFCGKHCFTMPRRVQHEYLHIRRYQCSEEGCTAEGSTRQKCQQHNPHHRVETRYHAPRQLFQGDPLVAGWLTAQPEIRLRRVQIPGNEVPTAAISNLSDHAKQNPAPHVPPPAEPDLLIHELPVLDLNTILDELFENELLNHHVPPPRPEDNHPLPEPLWDHPLPNHAPAVAADEAIRLRHLEIAADLQTIQELTRRIEQNRAAIQDLQEFPPAL